MGRLSRFVNVWRRDRLTRDIDEELESHVHEAVEHGRDEHEARAAFGPPLRWREESRDIKLMPWLESLSTDAPFGWRQLTQNGVTSAAAILSLALAIGACGAAFRIADALLWRPLPIHGPERLFFLSREVKDLEGSYQRFDGCEYPLFRGMRDA